MASDVGEQLRAEVARRAGYRCEYCLIHENDSGFRHEVHHVISRKHGGTSAIENLAYACISCNRYKGSDVASIDPLTGEAVALFNHRRRVATHFRLEETGVVPLTDVGLVTVRVLRLNATERVLERRFLSGRFESV